MATRFLKVQVEKTLVSEVYVAFEEDDPAFGDWLKDLEKRKRRDEIAGKFFRLPRLADDVVAEAIEVALNNYDWENEADDRYSHFVMREVGKAEACEYGVYDATKKEKYKP